MLAKQNLQNVYCTNDEELIEESSKKLMNAKIHFCVLGHEGIKGHCKAPQAF